MIFILVASDMLQSIQGACCSELKAEHIWVPWIQHVLGTYQRQTGCWVLSSEQKDCLTFLPKGKEKIKPETTCNPAVVRRGPG